MISVGYLITLYNKQDYLPQVLKGLENQEGFFSRQFVFVDDGSTDNTLKILKKSTEDWENITIISQKNQGPSKAFNRGLREINTKYLKPMDGDDILISNATSVLLEGMKKNPEAALVFGNQSYDKKEIIKEVKWELIKDPIKFSYRRSQILSPSAWLARTSDVKEQRGCDEEIFVQDYSLELRMSLKGPFARTKSPVYISPKTAPGRLSENTAQTLHDLNLALANICKNNNLEKRLRNKIYHRAASRAFRWARRHKKSSTIYALYEYLKSFFPLNFTWKDIKKTCRSFQQSHSIRLDKNSSPLKVMHILAAGHLRGGTERLMVRTIRALKTKNVCQAVISKSNEKEAEEEIKKLGVPVISTSQRKRSLLSRLRIWIYFYKFMPDIAMSWLPRAAERIPRGPWLRLAQVNWKQGVGCYKNADALLVPSPGIKKHMEEQINKPIYIFPHFVDKKFVNKKKIKKEKPVVLCLGRFAETKGFDLAIRALPFIKEAELWILGDGEEKKYLQDLVKELNLERRVVFFPWKESIDEYFSQATVLLVPSREEPLGLVILEGWAQGVPVVSTKTDGGGYLIEEGKTGLLVDKEDIKGISIAVNKLLESKELCTSIAHNSLLRVENYHTEEVTAQPIVNLLEDCIENIRPNVNK